MKARATPASKEALHREWLLQGLTDAQAAAVRSSQRRVLLVAGAGSGKTEVMARRVAWWVAVEGIPKGSIVAFTFTERAAEEMKFRIRSHISGVTPEGDDSTLGDMYVGTIHGYCLKQLRESWPDDYHNYDIVDEGARIALVQRVFGSILGLSKLQNALSVGKQFKTGMYATIDYFLLAYDLLNEYNALAVELDLATMPRGVGPAEAEWCKEAHLLTDVGNTDVAQAFAMAAARFYAYMRCRRFLDFSTSQSECVRRLSADPAALERIAARTTHVVVDEVQDINDVQDQLVRLLVGPEGHLTAVGDHRQAIFGWRGGRVDIMAALYEELAKSQDGQVLDLTANFRSTPRIIDLANRWARTIGPVATMSSPDMDHGRTTRIDLSPTHCAAVSFATRDDEAAWIADTVASLVTADGEGAFQDTAEGTRGLAHTDIAVLIRSSTDARTYMRALERRGIDAVFRAGPDLFDQPEVLLFIAALAGSAGEDQFWGVAADARSMPGRIQKILACPPTPKDIIPAALAALRGVGLSLEADVEDRLLVASHLIHQRIEGNGIDAAEVKKLHTPELRAFLRRGNALRRVFPQRLFQLLLGEAGVAAWDQSRGRGRTAMFHLGQLSTLVTGIETPGWVSPRDFKYQVQALCLWGTKNARTEEAPLLVSPDAVTICTIHAAKGLQFPVVFLADVVANRFPSSRAKTPPHLPFDGSITTQIVASNLADNAHNDDERRLMYVAITRAERYLFVSKSGTKTSKFYKELIEVVDQAGGTVTDRPSAVPGEVFLHPTEFERETRLVTSFSDLRYYLECPHDFYLRKVLGFSPTIDQAFGYGRGVHNLMRAVHTDPKRWADLATDPDRLEEALRVLIERGLFYLRYTTGDPERRMREKAQAVVADYVKRYSDELERVLFEPERPFETLIEEEQTLVSGAMDVIRLDDPPRVTIIDFKSGEQQSDLSMKLDEEEMRLQVGMYGMAAKRELEFEPELGLVRYLAEEDDDKKELTVPMNAASLADAHATVAKAAGKIRRREFEDGPLKEPHNPRSGTRCVECDFLLICGRPGATAARQGSK